MRAYFPVKLIVENSDPSVRAHRKVLAERVLAYFGDALPASRLLCFLDDNDFGRIRGERGRYQPIHENTILTHLPEYVIDHIRVHDGVSLYYQRDIDDLVYLCETACVKDVGLTMTLAHEIQHSIQHGTVKKLWALNSLIHQLPKHVIVDLKLIWPDIPTELDARIESKRIAVKFFGGQRVTEYVDHKIRESTGGVNNCDFADWQFVRTMTPDCSIDIAERTQKIFQHLKKFRTELEDVLRRCQEGNPEDFSDVDLNDFLLPSSTNARARKLKFPR